jgi:hypothetical protein
MRNIERKVIRGPLALAAVAAGLMACSSDPPPQQPPPPPPPAPTPVVTTPPPPTETACDAGQIQEITTQFAGRLTTEAPKMEPEGQLVCMNVQEGGVTTGTDFTMYPDYCYTVLGTGLPGVQDVDLQVTLDPAAAGFPPALAAFVSVPLMVDNIANAITAANPGKDCYHYALPLPGVAKLTVKAKLGSGAVAAQIYKKKLK